MGHSAVEEFAMSSANSGSLLTEAHDSNSIYLATEMTVTSMVRVRTSELIALH